MPSRKSANHREEKPGAALSSKPSRAKRLQRAARTTMLVAGVAAARLMAETEFAEMKFFSPGLVDRLQAPLSRIHE